MADIDTFNTKVFGENAPLYKIGNSQATGNLAIATDLEDAQALTNYANGLLGLIVTLSPENKKILKIEELTPIIRVLSSAIRSGDQQGIKEWKDTLEFQQYGITRKPNTSELYISLVANNINNALTDITKWLLLGDLALINTWLTSFNIANKLIKADTNGFVLPTNLPRADQVIHDAGTSNTTLVTPQTLANGKWGAYVFLQTQNITTSTPALILTNLNIYTQYEISLINIRPVTANDTLQMQVSNDNGVTWLTGANYSFVFSGYSSTGTVRVNSDTVATGFTLTDNENGFRVSNLATEGWTGTVILHNLQSTTQYKQFSGYGSYLSNNNTFIYGDVGCRYSGNLLAINAVRFIYNGGNIASGSCKVYGIK